MALQILIPCIFKQLFGFDCPGCGAQRSLLLLLHGHLLASVRMYPALVPFLFLILYYFYTRYQKSSARKIDYVLVALMLFVAVLIVANYGYKVFTGNIY